MMIHLAGDFEQPISRGISGAEGPRQKNFVGPCGRKAPFGKFQRDIVGPTGPFGKVLWGIVSLRLHLETCAGENFCLDKLFFVLWDRGPHLERLCGFVGLNLIRKIMTTVYALWWESLQSSFYLLLHKDLKIFNLLFFFFLIFSFLF